MSQSLQPNEARRVAQWRVTSLRQAFQRRRAFEQEVLPGVDVLAVQELRAGEGGWQLGYRHRRMLASVGTSHAVTARMELAARTGSSGP